MMRPPRLRQLGERNRLALALERHRAADRPLVDLTLSNPTRAGFTYPRDLLDGLADGAALRYDPAPAGLASAREAVSADYARRGVRVRPEQILLTASTSDAYSMLFKLLCEPGDRILAPQPSYPLIEHLTLLDSVATTHYPLEFHGKWALDAEGLLAAVRSSASTPARAIITISPNNPTGSCLDDEDILGLVRFSRDHGLAIVSDEVFADYPMSGSPIPSALIQSDALTFALGGCSKSIGLPQVKLGWIALSGPPDEVADAMDGLEMIADAYLSVGTPVQVAAPSLLQKGAAVRTQIQRRVRENYVRLRMEARGSACSVLPVEGGWYAVLQVPAIRPEEDLVVGLLERRGVLVHPGYFFDFAREAFLVLSLLPDPEGFLQGVHAILEQAEERG